MHEDLLLTKETLILSNPSHKQAKTFTRILNNKGRRKEWTGNNPKNIDVHRGQRKLLLSEIEFIINEYN